MKKYLAAAALAGLIGFTGISLANARGYGYGPGPGYGDCQGPRSCSTWYADKDDEKAAAFREETKALRKEIVVKRSELDALMRQDNPDEKKVAQLTGDLFDLESQMDNKAEKAFGDRPGDGPGPGYCNCSRRGAW